MHLVSLPWTGRMNLVLPDFLIFQEKLEVHIYYFRDVFQFANVSNNSIKTVRAKQDMIADNYGL